jgi:tetratricopeptide (TPR) repeat protein
MQSVLDDKRTDFYPAGVPTERIVAAPTVDLPAGWQGKDTAADAAIQFSSGEVPAESQDTAGPSAVPGYEILGLLGHGGMGVVYKARHLRLNRIVALKMVLAGAHANPGLLIRFHIEAEAVASLQHPNIVQIYEIGEHNRCPYFSLEFVAGGSLEQWLRRSRPTPPQAAQIIAILARAMHAAHQRGIVHRDLKPANVLLAPQQADDQTAQEEGFATAFFCRLASQSCIPKITDFGLAKRLEEDAEPAGTQTGSILGTPSYMAPEQAGGKTKEIGPLADVYALGAMLYELLTGKPPFRGKTPLEVLHRVVAEEPVPPSRVRPRTPRDLETICLKCLQKEPRRRYATAGALAEDLRRFLAGEPIQARPVGAWERGVKWAKRRPAAAALVGVSAIAVLGLIAGGWWYAEAQARLRHEAEQARDEADRRFAFARRAVDEMYTDFAEKWLEDEPQREEVQEQFIGRALAFYQEFAREQSARPDIRRDTALAHFRVGEIHRKRGRYDLAIGAYTRAIRVQGELHTAFPADPRYPQDLGNSHNWCGEALRREGNRLREAEGHFRKAQGLQQQLARTDPDRADYQGELARSYNNLGILKGDTGQPQEATELFREAVRVLEGLVAKHPAEPTYQRELARCRLNFGPVLRATGADADAQDQYRQGILALQDLVRRHPRKHEYRFELAVLHNNYGILLAARQRPAEILREHTRALQLLEDLVRDFPRRGLYRKELANTHNSLGSALLKAVAGDLSEEEKARRYGEVEREWGKALGWGRQLAEEFPDVADYQFLVGRAHDNLGLLAYYRKDLARAARHFAEAAAYLRAALRPDPSRPSYRDALHANCRNRAETLVGLKRHVEAVEAARELTQVDAPDREAGARRYFAACFVARCVPLAEGDPGTPAQDQRQALGRSYADQAVRYLREAVAAGYRPAEDRPLDQDPYLASLRTHAGFLELLQEVKATGPAKP